MLKQIQFMQLMVARFLMFYGLHQLLIDPPKVTVENIIRVTIILAMTIIVGFWIKD